MSAIPGRDASEFEWVAFEQSGVLTTAQAEALLGRQKVRSHLAARRWRRVCRGILCTHNGRLERDQQLWVAVLAAGRDAVLGGVTALAEAKVRGIEGNTIHLVIPAERNRTHRLPPLPDDMPPLAVHRSSVLPPEHLQVARPPRTTTARSAVDAAVWSSSAERACSVIAATCQQGRASTDEIFAVLAALRRVRRRALLKATLTDIAGGAQSLPEIEFVRLCRRFSLPLPEQQEPRRDATGRLRFLDAYWPRWRLHVEVDGAHHLLESHWAADMLRQNDIWIRGDRILRFPARTIRVNPGLVAAQLRAALTAAGWTP